MNHASVSTRRRWLGAMTVTGMILAAGCNADDAEPPAADEPPAEEPDDVEEPDDAPEEENGEPVTLELVAENNEFDQETLTVPAGAMVTIEFDNQDVIGHNFALYEDDSVQDVIFRGDVVTDTTTTYEFQAPDEPGTYYFQCDPHPQEMNGEFIVEE